MKPVIDMIWPQRLGWVVLIASTLALTTAFTAQFGFDMEPCQLCLLQRIPYGVAVVLALLAIRMAGVWRVRLYCLLSLVFVSGAVLAFYHSGVEQHWWASATSCGGNLADDLTPENLMAALQVKQAKACDQINWAIFGVSITVYNVLVSLVLAALTGLGGRALSRRLQGTG